MKLVLETLFDVGDKVLVGIWYDKQRREKGIVTDIYVENEQVCYRVKLYCDYTVVKATAKDLAEVEI